MTKVAYLDPDTQEWGERDMSPEEEAQHAEDIELARKPAVNAYTTAIQNVLDAKMVERRYFSILSACSYATSTNPIFQAEALACVAWRDAVWAKAYLVLDEVEAGKRAQPTVDELLALLPELTWPA